MSLSAIPRDLRLWAIARPTTVLLLRPTLSVLSSLDRSARSPVGRDLPFTFRIIFDPANAKTMAINNTTTTTIIGRTSVVTIKATRLLFPYSHAEEENITTSSTMSAKRTTTIATRM